MAIKISGNTIIDDSRNLVANTITATTFTGNAASVTSIPDFLQVLAPTNVSPADGATDQLAQPTLQISSFQGLGTLSIHSNTQFQVSIDSQFSNTEVDVFTGANTTVVIPNILDVETEYFFRARYFVDSGCCSAFSAPTCFTTGAAIEAGVLGASTCGGFYMGTIDSVVGCYYLIMAPNATGCSRCAYRTSRAYSGVGDESTDGYGHTYDHLTSSTYPGGNWARTRTINGFSDWYLPASAELKELYNNQSFAPAGEGFEHVVSDGIYLSSTEMRICFPNGSVAVIMDPDRVDGGSGNSTCNDKLVARGVRAIRRVPF